MIVFTGDTHADFTRFFNGNWDGMTKEDYVIICGDFRGVWNGSPHENRILDKLDKLPFTLLFVCGNHENFHLLYNYPVKEWHGGLVHEVRPHVLHLMRGEIFDIDGYKVFAMGGARSHDISDGILDPDKPNFYRQKRRLNNDGKSMYRILGKSWWPEEEPTEDELLQGGYHLHQANRKVDFIISHEGPTSLVAQLGYDNLDIYPLMEFLEEVKQKCQYKRWFFGHHHLNHNFDDKHTMLWFGTVEVN